VTLGAYSYQENPENEYLLLHSVPAWRALELLWGYDAEKRDKMVNAVDHVFQQACLYTDSREDIVTSYDLVMADPTVADFLQSVRVPSIFDTTVPDRPRKRRRTSVTKSGQPVITFITGNEKKLEEVQRILGLENGGPSDLPFHLTNAKIDLPELQGEAISVAREKCVTAAEKVEGAVMVEDTSLCFNALNGMPGVFIKWFLDAVGHEGLNKMIAAYDDKTAYAQTVVAFSPGPGHDPALFVGRTDGKIVMPRGRLDFGWDPVFEPNEGRGRTYAEMSKEEKDAISHRSRAFTQMRHYLQDSQAEILRSMDAAN
jgi:inosine triphosphate pyrophosphatase